MMLENTKYIDLSDFLDKNKYRQVNKYIYQKINENKKLQTLVKSYLKSPVKNLKINKNKSDKISINKIVYTTNANNYEDNGLNIRFIDCKNADAIVIENKGKYAIVDFGRENNQVLNYLEKTNCKKIDFALVTHCHGDHIKDITNISNKYNIENLVTFSKYAYTKQSDISFNNIKKISDIKAYTKAYIDEKIIKEEKFDTYKLGDIKFTFLSPVILDNNLNGNSLVLLLEYKNFKVLLTGDIDCKSELRLIKFCKQKGIDLSKINIVKLAHHGSKYSSSEEFLNEFDKDFTIPIISGDGINIDATKEKIEKFENKYTTFYNGNISVNVPANQNEIYNITCTQDGKRITSTFTIEEYIKEGVYEDNQSKTLDEKYKELKENVVITNINNETMKSNMIM